MLIGGGIRRALRRSAVMESEKSILQLLLFENKRLIKRYETLSIIGENCAFEGWRRKWIRFCFDFCRKYLKNKPCELWTLAFCRAGCMRRFWCTLLNTFPGNAGAFKAGERLTWQVHTCCGGTCVGMGRENEKNLEANRSVNKHEEKVADDERWKVYVRQHQ